MSNLLCDRPHVKTIDFAASRFVVSTVRGLNVDGVHLEMGDEVPVGALNAEALRLEYEPPTRRIELLEYAVTEHYLREACARRGVLGPGGVSLGPTEVNLQPSPVEAPSEPAATTTKAPIRPPMRKKR